MLVAQEVSVDAWRDARPRRAVNSDYVAAGGFEPTDAGLDLGRAFSDAEGPAGALPERPAAKTPKRGSVETRCRSAPFTTPMGLARINSPSPRQGCRSARSR